MPMNLQNVRLRLLAKYGSCKEEDIPIIVSIFLEKYQDCDEDEIPTMISDYLMLEMCNLPYVGYYDETDEDEEENEENFYSHNVSQVVLQDSSISEFNCVENSDLEDDGSVEYENDYSNDFVLQSLEFIIDDSEEEEEYYQIDNYFQPPTQSVLQESDSFEHDTIEKSEESGCSNSDFEESMEKEVRESEENSDLEAEKSAATTFRMEEPSVLCQGSNDIVGHNDIIKELQEMLGIDDERLEELVGNGIGDDKLLNAEFDMLNQANEEQACAEIFGGNDSTTMESKSGLVSYCLPCNDEFKSLIELKPPSEFSKEMVFSGGEVESKIGYGQMNQLQKFDNLASLNKTSECFSIHYFEEPPDYFSCVKNHLCLRVRLTMFQIESMEERKVHTRLTSFSLRMIRKIVKPKENVLKNEYDWKGIKILIDYPP